MLWRYSSAVIVLLLLLLLFSLSINVFLLVNRDDSPQKQNDCLSFVPENDAEISLFDRPESVDYDTIQYDTFSLQGDRMLFLSFRLHGTIAESIKRKYHMPVSIRLVRNIQNIVYFFNGFSLDFRRGDTISLYYRPEDEVITYMRYKNRRKRIVAEAVLFDDGSGERYFSTEGNYLVPCLENGPFSGCPNALLTKDSRGIVPRFMLPPMSAIRLPFMAKIRELELSRQAGGKVEVMYSNFMKRGIFKEFASLVPSIKKGHIYKKGVVIGHSGYRKNARGEDGFVYYIVNGDGRVYSPFRFHHISYRSVKDEWKSNFDIAVHYYRRAYRRAKKFEKYFFN